MLQESWEKQHTVHGIPYYVNHNLKKTQWDHPYLLKIMHDIGDYNYIQFAAYRTAGKLFYIQKELRLNTIAISTLQEMFERHGYSNTSHVTNIGCRQLYAVLYDIYMHGRCNQTQHISCETLAELTTNYVLNMYDVSRGGTVKVSSVKTGLAILCDGKLIDKYRYIFDALSDVTCCINRNTLHDFLFDVTQIPDYIQESVAFGGVDVHAAVNSCLKQSGHSEKSVNIDMFLQWLFREPQTIVWLTTLHRMTKAKNVKHDITCAVCKVHPVIGLRYKCLQCFHYNICQECFFGAKQSKSHKSTHPMQEYCSTSSTKDGTKAFVKTIMNKLSRKHRKNTKLSYLPITKPVQRGDDTTDYFDSFDSTSFGTERYLATPYKDTDTNINLQPIHNNQFELKVKKEQEALENILKQIEEENRGLIGELSALHQCEHGSKDKCKLTHRKLALQKHSTELDRHIEKLKSIIQQSDYKSIQAATESITHITKGSKPEGVSTLDIDIPAAVHTRGESMLMTDNEQRTCGNEQVVIQHENSMYTEELDGNVADVNNETAYSHQDPSVCTLLDELSTMDIEQSTDCTLTDVTYSEMYSQEKQQIQRLIEKLQQTYNSDTSILSCTGDMNHTMDEMVNAANQIAEAMTDFVGNKHSVLDDPSLLDLADELGLGVDTDESVL